MPRSYCLGSTLLGVLETEEGKHAGEQTITRNIKYFHSEQRCRVRNTLRSRATIEVECNPSPTPAPCETDGQLMELPARNLTQLCR